MMLEQAEAYRGLGGKHYTNKVWREQRRLVEKNAALSNIVSVVVAVVLVALLWNDMAPSLLLAWLGFMVVIFSVRVVMGLIQGRHKSTELVHDIFGRWYLLAILLTACGWGVSGFMLFPESAPQQLALGFIIAGMASGGVSVMAPILKLYFLYLLLVIIPIVFKLALMGGEYRILAFVTLGYLSVMAMIGYRINKSILNALELRFHNEELIKFMSQARNESEDLNEELAEEIEQRKQVETELQKAKDSAEAASKTKSEFLANMSHEIRTPMNGILGTLQLLQSSRLEPQQKDYVQMAYNSGEALLSLLNDILDFSKIEAGKLELEEISFSIKELLKEVCVLMEHRAKEKEIQLSIEVDDEIPDFIKGDSVRIRQIASNLLTNAIKFTNQGEVRLKLKLLSNTDQRARLKLEVCDTGIGISDEAQRKLFSSFTQADGSTTRKYGGTGLGLAIVRQLVILMRGRIGLQSKLGEGSSFWVEIDFDIVSSAGQTPAALAQTAGDDLPASLLGQVLLVEDNPVNQVVAVKMLEKLGLEFNLVNNGEEAVDELKQHHEYDLVLMDCQMPVMDGYKATELLRRYEADGELQRVPVIAMTANAMQGDKEKCISAGMDDYIAKPVRMNALKSVLDKWLRSADDA